MRDALRVSPSPILPCPAAAECKRCVTTPEAHQSKPGHHRLNRELVRRDSAPRTNRKARDLPKAGQKSNSKWSTDLPSSSIHMPWASRNRQAARECKERKWLPAGGIDGAPATIRCLPYRGEDDSPLARIRMRVGRLGPVRALALD